ncbi:MAG: hypothetical protein K6T28_09130 [Acidothermus sp.]|nr:hypothetical protein [Acidothermus sp.]
MDAQRMAVRSGSPADGISAAAARYDAAMFAVRRLLAELDRARGSGASPAVLRGLHAQIDYQLARAVEAARTCYDRLFATAGDRYRADGDPQVLRWKRRLNDALTLRSQHQLEAMDEVGALVPALAPVTRCAAGPHQAGLDFDTERRGAPPTVDLTSVRPRLPEEAVVA